MKDTIIQNSICITAISKLYKLICQYFGHSIIYKGFCSFTHRIRSYSQHSKILQHLTKRADCQKISLYRVCMSKIENVIADITKVANDIYLKSSKNSLLFKFFHKREENIKKGFCNYILLILLGGIVSFNLLGLFFSRLYLGHMIISLLLIVGITVFYLNSSNIIENSKLVNIFIKLLNSDIRE